MMFPFALQVVVLLFIIGGLIAYIGNYVGRYIGKRRLTIFNLRPRHTATAITVISGTLIAVSTLLVLLAVSQDARTAFLGLEKLKGQISEKSKELSAANETLAKTNKELEELQATLAAAKVEISQLQKTRANLSREIKVARQGEVLFRNGEVISLSLIQAGPDKGKIEAGLKKILANADASLRSQGIKSEKQLIAVDPDDFNQAVYSLLGENKIFVVELVAARNALWGEQVPANFELVENKLVYREGEEIISSEISPGLTASQTEQEVMKTLRLARQAAREAGVLPDPSGSLGSIPYSQIFDVAKKIKGSTRKVNLKILAGKDIHAIGPLEVQFKVSY
jgi:uncharacterized protein (DUF3084 family)